jgi:hypothetical protein
MVDLERECAILFLGLDSWRRRFFGVALEQSVESRLLLFGRRVLGFRRRRCRGGFLCSHPGCAWVLWASAQGIAPIGQIVSET